MLFGIIIFYPLLKPEHTVGELLIYMLRYIRFVRVGVLGIIKLNDLKSAAVDVKMNVPLFKIRSHRFSHSDLRIQPFNLAPSSIADSLAVNFRRDE